MISTFVRLLAVVLLCVSVSANYSSRRSLRGYYYSPCVNACAAVKRTDLDTLRGLIDGSNLCGCVCNMTTGTGLLHETVAAKCGLCIDLLTSKPSKCPCDDKDFANNTALHYAAEQCRMEINDDLTKTSCNISAVNNVTDTPLCVASRQKDENCGGVARSLMKAGADPCFICSDGDSAIGGCVNKVVCDVMEEDIKVGCY